jgi:tetratricopeptide (TPR) repeat protein
LRRFKLLLYSAAIGTAAFAQTPAEDLIEAGHWKQARALVQARLRENPKDALATFLSSQLAHAFGDHESPLTLAERAVELDPSVGKYHRQLAEALGIAAQRANVVQQLFLARRFRKELDLALGLNPRDVQAQRDLLEYYLLAPGIAGGDKAKASAVAEQIARLDVVQGYFAKARLTSDRSKIGALYRAAVEAQPDNYKARIALAEFLLGAAPGDLDGAMRQATEAIRIDRGRVDAYSVLAAVYAATGDTGRLETTVETAAREVPLDLTPCYRAADELLKAGRDPGLARRLLLRYLAAEPEGNAPSLATARQKLTLIPKQISSSRN